jgi:hypothetical protein
MKILLCIVLTITTAIISEIEQTIRTVRHLRVYVDSELVQYGGVDQARVIEIKNHPNSSELLFYSDNTIQSTKQFYYNSLSSLPVVTSNDDLADVFLVARDIRKAHSHTLHFGEPKILQVLRSGEAVERDCEYGEPVVIAVTGDRLALLFFNLTIENREGSGLIGTISFCISTSSLDPTIAIPKPIELENSSAWVFLGVWMKKEDEYCRPIFLFSEVGSNKEELICSVEIAGDQIQINRHLLSSKIQPFGTRNIVFKDGLLNRIEAFDLSKLRSLDELSETGHLSMNLQGSRLVDLERSTSLEWYLLLENQTTHVRKIEIVSDRKAPKIEHERAIFAASTILVRGNTVFVW